MTQQELSDLLHDSMTDIFALVNSGQAMEGLAQFNELVAKIYGVIQDGN